MGEKSRPTYTFPAVIVVLHSSLLTRAAALYRSLTPCALSFSPSHLHHVLPYVGGELVEVSAGEAEDAQSHRDKTKRQHRHLERSAHPRPERRERDSTQHAPCKVDKTYGCVKNSITFQFVPVAGGSWGANRWAPFESKGKDSLWSYA